MKKAAQISISIHLGILALFAIVSIIFSDDSPRVEKVKVEIREIVNVKPVENEPAPEIQLSAKPPEPPPAPAKKVFGLNKSTLQAEGDASVNIKAGNTVAKDIDQEKIDLADADPLPIPAEEYLVTQMPRLRSEVRIPYPTEARKKNIEGAVVMDILIDETGKVRSATLLEGPGYGLNEAALEAIYKFQFSPAVIDTKAVAVRIRYSYRFVLK